MRVAPNCSENCAKCKDCANHDASLSALVITVANISARMNVSIDHAISATMNMLDDIENEKGDILELAITCPDENNLYLLREGWNYLRARRDERRKATKRNPQGFHQPKKRSPQILKGKSEEDAK